MIFSKKIRNKEIWILLIFLLIFPINISSGKVVIVKNRYKQKKEVLKDFKEKERKKLRRDYIEFLNYEDPIINVIYINYTPRSVQHITPKDNEYVRYYMRDTEGVIEVLCFPNDKGDLIPVRQKRVYYIPKQYDERYYNYMGKQNAEFMKKQGIYE